ncbi:unnamed protein product [Sphagnum jensenii]|uniref:Uncharacterized protein n=1 Tax=Sphagnum jensenii TaxID=128206 RepID=A0ABP0VX01_9BRYO
MKGNIDQVLLSQWASLLEEVVLSELESTTPPMTDFVTGLRCSSKIIPVHDLNPKCISPNPDLVIIFFHGIAFGNDEWKETWTSTTTNRRNEPICWPEKWLPEDMGNNVRILSLSYDSNLMGVHNNVANIGKNLIHSLVRSRYDVLWDAPIVLVGYSFGGLVLKSLVVEVQQHIHQRIINLTDAAINKSCKRFLENLKGTIFYGVPHAGGSEGFLKYFSWKCQQINTMEKKLRIHSSLLRNLTSFNRQMEELSMDFENAISRDLIIYAFSEGQAFEEKWGVLVPYASSQRLAGANNYMVEDANHFTICRPPTKDHPSYFKLVECLKICLKKQSKLPSLPKFEVGLDNIATDVIKLLEKVSIIGLVGMGGIGKTTLSKNIYRLIYKQYDKCSYLEDVKSKHLHDVQKQLLRDLCDKDKDVNDDDLNNIKCFTTLKKVLVIIDDVGTTENLVALHDLLVNGEEKKNKSKIIVTCRNWQILENHVNEAGKVDVNLLEERQAKRLFMFHAYGVEKKMKPNFNVIIDEIVKACGGLPLNIEVMGRFLNTKHCLQIWKEALWRLSAAEALGGGRENEVLWNKLKISYDDLEEEEKNMFLDIACFFNGHETNTTFRIGTYRSPILGLRNLKDRSLVKITKDGYLNMHEQLKDMGQKIALEQRSRIFIWNPKKPNYFLANKKVEGMSITSCEEKCSLPHQIAKELPNLKLLTMTKTSSSVIQVCIQQQNQKKLKWLHLQECNMKKLPFDLTYFSDLRIFHLVMCYELQELPPSIGQLNTLQEIKLCNCSQLNELPISIDRLIALQELDLSLCSNLKELPTSIGQLNALQKLNLFQCSMLKELPASICQLTTLKTLNLSKCSQLKELPTSIGQLTTLQTLDLSSCSQLKELPTSIGQLTTLQTLTLSNCSQLKELPTSIGQLIKLQTLDLSECSQLKELPTSTGQLTKLQTLDLSYCSHLKELPTSIGQLTTLQMNCPHLLAN